MRLLVKIGGAQRERDDARGTLAQSLQAAREAGHEIVIVHGGGNQIRALSKRLGIEASAPTTIQERAVGSSIWFEPAD